MDSLEALVAALAQELNSGRQPASAIPTAPKASAPSEDSASKKVYTRQDYPMLEKHRDTIRTPTGKRVDDITLESVLNGQITLPDVRISPEMLRAQADIAQDAGKPAMGENLRRAAELTEVPDDEVIRMYDMLRPNRSTKAQLDAMAEKLEKEHHAFQCATLVREAVLVYEKRGILKEG